MEEKFIRILFDLKVERLNNQEKPGYRLYINDELFTERNWRWPQTCIVEELLQIKAVPGKYKVKIKKSYPTKVRFNISNMRVDLGDARIIEDNTIEILKNENI